jgi:hemerythrin
MHQIIWKEEYLTGIEEIDRQHMDFVKMINRLNIIQEYGDNLEYALRLMAEVGKYADYHFTCEENIMYLTKYPDLEKQEKAHKALLEEYGNLMQSFENKEAVLEDVIKYLAGWFAKHSVELDKRIGMFLQSRKK